MLPADQRLHSNESPGAHVRLRLVVQDELIQFQRAPHFGFELMALDGAHVHFRGEELKIVPPAFLGVVHGGVRILHQFAAVLGIVGENTDTDAAGGVERVPGDSQRLGERPDDLARNLGRVVGLAQTLEGDDELVATQPRQGVALAYAGGHLAGDFLEQQVAYVVAERVVDVLEAVQVDEQHRERIALAARVDDPLLETVVEQQAVWQFGQRIAGGEITDTGVRFLYRGYVPGRAAVAGRMAQFVKCSDPADMQPECFPVFGDEHVLQAAERAVGFHTVGEPLPHPLWLLRRHELGCRMADQFLGGVTQDFDYFRGEVRESARVVVLPHELAGGLGDVAEALFAVPKRFLRGPACAFALEVIKGKRDILSELVD